MHGMCCENMAHNGQLFISICRRVEIRIISGVHEKNSRQSNILYMFLGESMKIVSDYWNSNNSISYKMSIQICQIKTPYGNR